MFNKSLNKESSYRSLCYSILSLALGFLFYISFRTNSIKIIGYLDYRLSFLHNFRIEARKLSEFLPNFLIYSLPDGLFLFSYTTFMLWLWEGNPCKLYWVYFLPLLLIIIEILQINHILSGTFDVIDIVMYVIFLIFTLLIKK